MIGGTLRTQQRQNSVFKTTTTKCWTRKTKEQKPWENILQYYFLPLFWHCLSLSNPKGLCFYHPRKNYHQIFVRKNACPCRIKDHCHLCVITCIWGTAPLENMNFSTKVRMTTTMTTIHVLGQFSSGCLENGNKYSQLIIMVQMMEKMTRQPPRLYGPWNQNHIGNTKFVLVLPRRKMVHLDYWTKGETRSWESEWSMVILFPPIIIQHTVQNCCMHSQKTNLLWFEEDY